MPRKDELYLKTDDGKIVKPNPNIQYVPSGNATVKPNLPVLNKPTVPSVTNPTAPKDSLTVAKENLDSHIAKRPGEYVSPWKDQLDSMMSDILNRKEFAYDIDGDALYNQYKDQYIRNGQLAMEDTMGRASALTGGYGNSYAALAGQQAYNAQLDNLNAVVPDLYAAAYDRYIQEGNDMLSDYALIADRDATDYARYLDSIDLYNDETKRLEGVYNDEVTAANVKAAEEAYKKIEETASSFTSNEELDSYLYGLVGTTLTEAQADALYKKYETIDISEDVPSDILDEVKSKSTLREQAEYVAQMVNKGEITEDQADELLEKYGLLNAADRTYTAANNGGINWFGGIDNNATVTDEYGNEIRLDALKDMLIKDGMTEKEAREFVLNLQTTRKLAPYRR